MSMSDFGPDFFMQYTRTELSALLTAVQDELKSRAALELTVARERIHAIAKEVGVPLGELVGKMKPVSDKPKVAPRYRNPADANEVWTGRGRQPRWVVAALDAGADMDSLLIPVNSEGKETIGVAR